jgi:glycosyltransferase involved in cell wall biosynthesis
MWKMILLIAVAACGLWLGKPSSPKGRSDFPLVEQKTFVFVIFAKNGAEWCERTLSSIFEQDYDHYRVIFVDDASVDQTYEKARQYIIDNYQQAKVLLIKNEKPIGKEASFARGVQNCLDREIVIPMEVTDWLSSPIALEHLNLVYQDPDVELVYSQKLLYPSYAIEEERPLSCYAAQLKAKGLGALQMKGRKAAKLDEPLVTIYADLAAWQRESNTAY